VNIIMDKARFEAIIAAYGADPRRWPQGERAAAQMFAAREGVDLTEARALDALLDYAPQPGPLSDLAEARLIVAVARRRAPRVNPIWAMAACMIGGVLIGVGAGLSAPQRAGADVDGIIVAAFASPLDWDGDAP
jgi:hypothetical protein